MLAAKQEGEALLKAEIVQLTEQVQRLREECLEHQGTALALQDRLAESEAAAVVCRLLCRVGQGTLG